MPRRANGSVFFATLSVRHRAANSLSLASDSDASGWSAFSVPTCTLPSDIVVPCTLTVSRRSIPRSASRIRKSDCFAASPPGIQVVPERRNHMVGRECCNPALLQLHGLADLKFAVAKVWLFGTRDLREIRPDAPIENMVPDNLQRCRNRPYRERFVAHS